MAVAIAMLRPDERFQARSIGDTQLALCLTDQTQVPETLQQPRDRFPTCSDHLGHIAMRISSGNERRPASG